MTDEKSRKVLAIDDNQTNLALIKVYLKQMGITSILANNAEVGMEIARNELPDLILLDIMMPGTDGYQACKMLKSDNRTSSIPIIFVSAKDSAADKIVGLELGAIDYICKPFNPGEFKARIGIVLQMLNLQEKLIDQANTDELTGLANRRHFLEIIEREILQTKLKGTGLALMMLDIDHFKNINDTYGHLGGDVVLKQMAKILRENIYPLDIAGRYGGEEFIILMPETSHEKAFRAAEKIRNLIEQCDWKISSEPLTITMSIGLSVINSHNSISSNELIKRADVALYAAKHRGRNCVVNWDQIENQPQATTEESLSVTDFQETVYTLAQQLRQQALGTIISFTKILAAKDPYLANHAENVRIYTTALAQQLNLTDDLTDQLETAALLHDLGKISIPNHILRETRQLTEQNLKIIRQHPLISVQILEPIGLFKQELQFIQHHHENFDGTGYPDGLIGNEIPFGARILAVANAFDAITSDRSHRIARSCGEALKEIDACSGSQFDPDVVEAFHKAVEKCTEQWPLGTKETSDVLETVETS